MALAAVKAAGVLRPARLLARCLALGLATGAETGAAAAAEAVILRLLQTAFITTLTVT